MLHLVSCYLFLYQDILMFRKARFTISKIVLLGCEIYISTEIYKNINTKYLSSDSPLIILVLSFLSYLTIEKRRHVSMKRL